MIISHANCMDGLAAAWAAKRALVGAEVVYASYGDPAPAVTGKHIVITDFSYPREVLVSLCLNNLSVMVIDHHKTAQAALGDPSWHPANFRCIFDMGRSGAQLVEDAFNLTRTKVVAYVGDRDIWKFELPNSHAINALLMSREPTFEWLDQAEVLLSTNFSTAVLMGDVLYNAQLCQAAKQAKNYVLKTDQWGNTYGYQNLTSLIGETADHTLRDSPFAYVATYQDKGDKRIFSLRSRGSFDVSTIAKNFGGGGHMNAAGFTLPNPSGSPL